MTSKKRKTLLDADDDDDNFDEDDSGSDFDDDEDPDQIEVPGGGRDLNTAVTYAQNIRSGVGVVTKGATPIPITGAKIVIGNNNIKPISLLRINNNNNNIINSGNSSSNNNNSNGNNTAVRQILTTTTAAAVGGASTVVGVPLGGKITPIPIIGRKVALENNLNNMPKKLNNTITAMGSPAARSSGNAAGSAGSTSSYLNSLSTNELMNLAAYVAAKGSSAPPPPPPSTAANSVRSSPLGGNNPGGGNFYGGAAASTSASAANFNMAASLLAQMSYAGGVPPIRPFVKVAGAIGSSQKPPVATSAGGGSSAGGGAGGAAGVKGNNSMMEAVQKLIAMNPEYLTSGIPNNVFQMIMQSMQRPPANPAPMQPVNTGSMAANAAAAAAAAAAHASAAAAAFVQQEEDEVDYEEMGVAETYADYWPAKLKLGKKHPDAVVETASLSSVEPCDVYYKLSLPHETINSGHLSALQLESITYASQAHDHLLPDGSRAGFLIGDGAGVGKGRTIAGIIYENYLKGRKKALWISVSNDLKYDAERDLSDIGATRIDVHALNKFKYAKISSDVNNNCKRGVIFSTYSALIGESNNKTGKYRSRFRQLLQWCGEDFEGLIIFDECHKAKNLCPVGSGKPTKTGQTVLELQQKLPKARVVYASATGASEPKNMAYMVRLGLWGQGTAFGNFNDFITAVERRGVGAMEIVAMDMKLRGMYIARQLSFKGVSFKIEEVPLSKEFRKIYDQSVELWVEAMQKFTEAAELIDAESRMKKTMWGQFWSSHQRFFKYLCIAAKVNHAVLVARESIKYGKCVVIGLQSTGEARTLDQLERDDGELTDFVSTAKGVFQSFVERHFPAPDRNRINRILGLYDETPSQLSIADSTSSLGSNNNNSSAAGGKRKGAASGNNDNGSSAAGGKSKKKKRSGSWQYSDSDDDEDTARKRTRKRDGGGNSNSDSDEADSDDEFGSDLDDENEDDEDHDVDSDRRSVASDASSDFNPFFSGSDSDIDPWVNARSKKTTKKTQKKTKKKVKKDKDKEKEKQPKKEATTSNSGSSTGGDASGSATTAMSATVVAALNAAKTRKSQLSTQDKIQDLLQKKQELKGTVTPVGVNGVKLNYGPPPKDAIERACTMKEELLRKIERLGSRLPPNTLDQLIDELGGPDNVAEMTGRRGRVVQNDEGNIQYESRTESDVPLETLNITEKQRFMDGQKDVAIISEAASSGISLQSDRRVFNQRRRVHITLELPWSADRAIQQFGRTHRSNQVNAPEYIFLISDLAGERRFASTVAKRLESLGALTHGDRRATETRDLSQFNIDNKYGRQALETVMRTIMGYESPLVPPPTDYSGEFFKDIAGALVGVGIIVNSESHPGVLSLDKDYNNISKFLNRILGCPVDLQNRLFKYFTDTMTAIIQQAKRGGRFDLGIVDLGAAGENVTRCRLIRFVRKHATGVAPTEMHTVRVERGMIWQEAIDKYADLFNDNEGFYLSHQLRNQKRTAIMVVILEQQPARNSSSTSSTAADLDGGKKKKSRSKKEIMCQIYRPNTGLQVRHESLFELEKKYRKVASEEAEPHWTEQYDASVNTCSHAYWNGNCRNVSLGNDCEVGLRQRLYHVLAGSVLSVWGRVEHILNTRSNSKMQVIRMKTTEGEKIVGTLIPKSCFEPLVADLRSDSEKQEEFNY
ncbi:protein strawberry notch isoform X1 [Drosophila elegans]|uniref:protein strawberry notch isoform X1 n=1 Tax=Drosophila elegans TaxID=30023 RepID=UPI0007E78CED|nr:protein strawberry notch isoform X1 [Drosophila elegans]